MSAQRQFLEAGMLTLRRRRQRIVALHGLFWLCAIIFALQIQAKSIISYTQAKVAAAYRYDPRIVTENANTHIGTNILPASSYNIESGVTTLHVCLGGSARLGTDTTNLPGYHYKWMPSDDLSADNVRSPLFNAKQSRLYVLQTQTEKGLTYYDTLMIWVEEWASPRFAPESDICEGSTSLYAITSTGIADSVTYLWSLNGNANGSILSGQRTNSISVQWNAAGNGSVGIEMVSIHYGCSTSGTHTVDVQPKPRPVIRSSSPTTICPGSDITLDAGEGYVWYQWSNGLQSRIITVAQEGAYSVQVANSNNCTNSSDALSINYHYVPQPTISGQSKICGGESIVLSARTGFVFYRWSDGSTEPQLTIHEPGSYSVRTIDSNGCSSASQTFEVSYYDVGLAMTSELLFGTQKARSGSTKEIVLTNNAGSDIKVEAATLLGQSGEFRIESTSVSLPYILHPKEEIRIRVYFESPLKGSYSDNMKITLSQPCAQQHSIPISGEVFDPALSIHTYIPNEIYDTGDSTALYPVYAKILTPDYEELNNLTLKMQMRWKARLFEPTGITKGRIVSSQVQDDERVIEIEVPGVSLSAKENAVSAIQGRALAATFFSTEARIVSYSWENVPRTATYTTSDGSISLRSYCFPRNIILGKLLNFSLFPNPAVDVATVDVQAAEAGTYTIKIFNAAGVGIWEKAFEAEEQKKYTLAVDCSTFGSGLYPVVLYSPSKTLNSLMMIAR